MKLNNNIAGLILVDKPCGITSSQVSLWLKNLLNEKTGHCGTLDPGVSGVLPVLVGKAVKLQEFLQEHNKEYICLMKTGKKFPEKKVAEVLKEFEGKIYQKPPAMSAVAKNIRVRNIYEIKLIETKDNLILFSVFCEHGTYIRKLVDDIGLLLGSQDAKMLELRRISVNGFREKDALNMFQIKDKIATGHKEELFKTLEFAVQSLPKADIDELDDLKFGKRIKAQALKNWKGNIIRGTAVAVFYKNKLVGVCKSLVDEPKKRDKGMLLQPVKVFI